MREMKENGIGGSMYGRDDMDEMMSMYGNGGDYADEEDSGEDLSNNVDEDENTREKINDIEF